MQTIEPICAFVYEQKSSFCLSSTNRKFAYSANADLKQKRLLASMGRDARRIVCFCNSSLSLITHKSFAFY